MMKKTVQFAGRHYETGSVQNILALQGVKAPHTGKPYSEAFLLGVSGGIAFGYFTFEYKGFLPHLAFLTRNTFDPFPTMLERLGVTQNLYQTTQVGIAEKNLTEALGMGSPVLVWADHCTLPYTHRNPEEYWIMVPIVVYGMDGDTALIADRSSQTLRVPMDVLTKARGRVKKDKYRLATIEPPKASKLAAAAQKGIWQCISLFTDKPLRGTRQNFGFAAYQHLADMLTNSRNKQSWERFFAPGSRMYQALAGSVTQPGAFTWINLWGAGNGAERALYADFLDEAAVLLERKSLNEAAQQFRLSHGQWIKFADALLPADVPSLYEAKNLMLRRDQLFIEKGGEAFDEIREIIAHLKKLESDAAANFPLTQAQSADLRLNLRDHVLAISVIEQKAVELLQASMK
jgi:endonuclease YncB( thermonuclease family)